MHRKWFKKINFTRSASAVTVTCLVVSLLTVTAFAFLSAFSGRDNAQFDAGEEIDPVINETFADNKKTNVTVDVGNPGYAVYVRAAIVATWQDGTGGVHWQKPESGASVEDNPDYVLNWNETDWFYNENDGYYYLKTMVPSGETPVLIRECYPVKAAPASGYQLNVNIIAQTVQAKGCTDANDIPAVTDAWGVGVNSNGTLKPNP